MDILFSNEDLQRIDKIKLHYPTEQSALMPVLWLAQKRFGWLSSDVMNYVADLLNLPLAHVEGVASFYTMYFKKPMGKYHIQVCTNVSCMLKDGDKIYKHISDKLNIKHFERTEDTLFSLEEVECMGACGGAPMVAINEDFYEDITIEKIDELIENLK